ncbi:MAG: hypothetical protein ACLQVL_34070 [Terriglobia bacterium]
MKIDRPVGLTSSRSISPSGKAVVLPTDPLYRGERVCEDARWQELFQARFDVLLYDLTSTDIEGQGAEIPKAQYGYSRDHRGDCRHVVIAPVVTPEGFPLAYEVMARNTSDRVPRCAASWPKSKRSTDARGGCA